ncbi:MAG: aminotransferase class IV [candidate division Zixibacteria bacterium]|nr:aminotransferase class IV [candidate division Zixibacteria bacterium]
MKKIVTSINGRIVSGKEARISVYDNSLLYAEGLFETFLAIDDRLAFSKEHFIRLRKGARLLGLKLSTPESKLEMWLKKTARAHPARLKRLRLTVTGGESAVWTGKRGSSQVICSAIEHQFDNSPLKLYAPESKIDESLVFNRIKTISYGAKAAALREAQKNKCDDALLINNSGNISELTSANIFWTKNNKIYTPPVTAGCLEGVTRKLILSEAKKNRWQIIEKNCSLKELKSAGEVFSSSSLRLVRAVGEIRAKNYKAKFEAGPMSEIIFRRICKILDI